jgi:hypothetical protein
MIAGLSTIVRASAQAASSVKRVQVLGNRTPLEFEIEAGDRLAPVTQVLTGPDRLVVDLPNFFPGAVPRRQTLNRSAVKSVRVGLFSSKPLITRVVFDLNGPQPYQVFPAGRKVIVKLGAELNASQQAAPAAGATVANTSFPPPAVQVTPAPAQPTTAPVPLSAPPLVVSFSNGKLTISSNKATLSEVLLAVHQRTGADIPIPAGAEQEQVVAELGPAPAPEVLSRLLNGSRFNFLILSSATDPGKLERVILTARPDGPAPAFHPLPQMPMHTAEEELESEPPARTSSSSTPNPNPVVDQAGPPNPGTGNPGDGPQN